MKEPHPIRHPRLIRGKILSGPATIPARSDTTRSPTGEPPVSASPLSLEHLARLIAPALDCAPEALALTPIATGKHNRSFWVDGAGDRAVLRIAPPDDAGFLFYEKRMMRQEPALHRLLVGRTTLPVAPILAHDFSRESIDRDWVLMAGLPGAPMSVRPLSAAQRARALAQTGAALAQLHRLTAPDCLGQNSYGYLGAHAPMPPQPTWADAFHLMWHLLLDDVVVCGAYSDDEADRMRRLLDRHARHFARPVPASLLHMDIWAQNLLVDAAGNLTGLVDFDRALWGDVEIEFAVLDYCGISEAAFWEGYGQDRDTSLPAQIRRLFYLLYEMQKYMPIAIWRRRDWPRALEHKARCLALAEQLDK